MAFVVGVLVVVALALVGFAVYIRHARLSLDDSSEHQAVADSIVRNFPDPVLLVDSEGTICSYSPSLGVLFGYAANELVGQPVEVLMPQSFAEQHREQRRDFMRAKVGRAMDNEVVCLSKSGEEISAITRVRTFEAGDKKLGLVSIQDLRQFKDREALLKNLSEQDPLTGLANRRLFDHDFSREWNRAMRAYTPISLLMIDVDAFKAYNDHYGHPAGDACLQQLAQILQAEIQRATDTVARYGGEEFICLMPALPFDESLRIAEDVRQAVEAAQIPHANSAVSPYVTISIGVAAKVPTPNYNRQLLVQAADSALYQAKAHGRNSVAAHDLDHETEAKLLHKMRSLSALAEEDSDSQ